MVRFILILALCSAVGCSKKNDSIYGNLAPDEDGVISSDIPVDDPTEPPPVDTASTPSLVLNDNLTLEEKNIVTQKHASQFSKFSFIIVKADSMDVMRSYRGQQARRLASVTKVATSIAALETVDGVSVDRIKSMLKSSHNGEASRYLRLAVKSLANFIAPGSAYSLAHSCPSSLKNENEAASKILNWFKSKIKYIDWQGSVLKDGAGCDYGNVMSPLQVISLLAFADQKGPVYGGLSYEKLLSISGVDGTWANRNTDRKGQVLAKTGTLNLNANLAGYFYAKRNGKMHKYYFAMLVEKKAGASTEARNFIEAMVRYWINYYSVKEGEPIAQL